MDVMFTTISPAMNRYMATQQAIQPQGQDAIGQGAARGIDAARTSLSMTPNISRPSAMARAIGGGAAAFKAPQPGTGQAGMLNSIAQAMGPAMQEYYREMDTRNALEMQMAEAQQKQQNEMMDRDYRQQVLGETSRHHRAMEHYHESRNPVVLESPRRAQLMQAGILPANAGPLFEEMKSDERKIRQKELSERKNRYIPAEENINNFKQADVIFKEHPNLWRNPQVILAAAEKPGLANQFFSSFSAKDKAAAQKLSKLMGDIALNEIKKFPGVKTDLVKKTIMKTLADGFTTPEAWELIRDKNIKKNERTLIDSKMAHEAWNNRYDIPEYLGENETENESAIDAAPSANDFSNLSTEDLLRMRAEAMNGG